MPNISDQLEGNNDLEKASNYIRHRTRLRPREFSSLHQHTYSGTRSHKCRNPPNDTHCYYALDKDEVDKSHKCCPSRRHCLQETIPLNQISQICGLTQTLS